MNDLDDRTLYLCHQGAWFLYRYVEINKELMGEKDLVPWMTWVNMHTDMLSLAEGIIGCSCFVLHPIF